jgi:hypothetical protein
MVVSDHNQPVQCNGIALSGYKIQAYMCAHRINEIFIRVLHRLYVLLVEGWVHSSPPLQEKKP